MSETAKKSGIYLSAAWACFSVLTVLAVASMTGKAATAPVGNGAAARSVFGTPLAIADFDGDQRPDLATVSVDRASLQSTDYSIRFRFSAAPASTIGLTARGGGLDLALRDVNGDEIVDLVVSTALDSQIVAVLVNDGHGNFSLAQPSAFPLLAANARVFLHGPMEAVADLTALASLRCTFGEVELAGVADGRKATECVFQEIEKGHTARKRQFRTGRSPPENILTA
jgi:hypothetical protein